jgi:hypothetical protein
MTTEHKEVVLAALSQHLGDDYARARAAFRHFTPQQMQEQWGMSGKTCQQILDEYKAHYDRVCAAMRWAEGL